LSKEVEVSRTTDIRQLANQVFLLDLSLSKVGGIRITEILTNFSIGGKFFAL